VAEIPRKMAQDVSVKVVGPEIDEYPANHVLWHDLCDRCHLLLAIEPQYHDGGLFIPSVDGIVQLANPYHESETSSSGNAEHNQTALSGMGHRPAWQVRGPWYPFKEGMWGDSRLLRWHA
jgi:hypothetical protein